MSRLTGSRQLVGTPVRTRELQQLLRQNRAGWTDQVVGAAITDHAPGSDNSAENDIVRKIGAALSR